MIEKLVELFRQFLISLFGQEPEIELPKEEILKSNDENNAEYLCPDCKEKIEFEDKFCKNCGCKINWE